MLELIQSLLEISKRDFLLDDMCFCKLPLFVSFPKKGGHLFQ